MALWVSLRCALARVLVLAFLLTPLGCGTNDRPTTSSPDPAPQARPSDPTTPAEATRPTGRWTGELLCFSLFENGDFELVVNGEPKVMIMGTATARDDGSFALATARIWRTRFTGPCRRIHETGRFADDERALGETFRPGETVLVRLARPSADAIELCATECATLRRDTPVVGAEWRLHGLTDAARPPAPYRAGQLVSIDIAARGGLWVGVSDSGLARVTADVATTTESSDRFALTVTPTRIDDAPAGAELTLLGAPLAVGRARSLRGRRLAGERVEICDGSRCDTLDRVFDPYDHELY